MRVRGETIWVMLESDERPRRTGRAKRDTQRVRGEVG